MSSLGDLHNDERVRLSLARLQAHTPLMRSAELHAEWMAKNSRMSHVGAGRKNVGRRVLDEGYRYLLVGENIAYGYQDEAQVLKAWLRSPGHRANVFHPNYRHIGYAKQKNSKGVLYWCVVFGVDAASYRSGEAAEKGIGEPVILES